MEKGSSFTWGVKKMSSIARTIDRIMVVLISKSLSFKEKNPTLISSL
jgi:hypothetical protein